MTLNIGDTTIQRMSIIDDDPNVRSVYQYSIEELELEPINEEGPIDDIEGLIKKTQGISEAAICDYHLRVHNYSRYNGAELVANLYKNNFPALLCTKWEDASIDEIRPYRRYIPALLRPDELEPDTINHALEVIIMEFKGKLSPSRQPWRTLVHIESIEEITPNDPFAYVILPAWDPGEVIRLRLTTMPREIIDVLSPGKKLHVQANIGAKRHEEIYFDQWEPD